MSPKNASRTLAALAACAAAALTSVGMTPNAAYADTGPSVSVADAARGTAPGTPLHFTATGFPAGANLAVNLSYRTSDAHVTRTVGDAFHANAAGQLFNASVTIPKGLPAAYFSTSPGVVDTISVATADNSTRAADIIRIGAALPSVAVSKSVASPDAKLRMHVTGLWPGEHAVGSISDTGSNAREVIGPNADGSDRDEWVADSTGTIDADLTVPDPRSDDYADVDALLDSPSTVLDIDSLGSNVTPNIYGVTAVTPLLLDTTGGTQVPPGDQSVLLGQGVAQVLDGARTTTPAVAWQSVEDVGHPAVTGVPTKTVKTPARSRQVSALIATYSDSRDTATATLTSSSATSGPNDLQAEVSVPGGVVTVTGTGVTARASQAHAGDTVETGSTYTTLTLDAPSASLEAALADQVDMSDVRAALARLTKTPPACSGLDAPVLPASIDAGQGINVTGGHLHVDLKMLLADDGLRDVDAMAALAAAHPHTEEDLQLQSALNAAGSPVLDCSDAVRNAQPDVAADLLAAGQRIETMDSINTAVSDTTASLRAQMKLGVGVTGNPAGTDGYTSLLGGESLTKHLAPGVTGWVRALEVTSGEGVTMSLGNAAAGVNAHGEIASTGGGGSDGTPKPPVTPHRSTTPPPRTTTHTTSKPTPHPAVGPPLASTGSRTGEMLALALALLAGGAGLAFLGRRRKEGVHRA